MKKLIYALRFMTIIPIKWKEGEDMRSVARSISFFPVVGLIIGFTNYSIFYISNLIFSPFLTSVIVVCWWIFITGGLHLDGLSDTSDGVWGGTTKERRLEIMKDSNTGVFGVLSLIAFLLLKTSTLTELFNFHTESIKSILITVPVLGRWISVFSIYCFKTAKKDGLGYFFKEKMRLIELLISLLFTTLIIFFFNGLPGMIILLCVTIISFPISLFFTKKLGGLTGDVYGTLCEITELLALFCFLILCSLGFIS